MKTDKTLFTLAATVIIAGSLRQIVRHRTKQHESRLRDLEEIQVAIRMMKCGSDAMTERIQSGYYNDKTYSQFMDDLDFALGKTTFRL